MTVYNYGIKACNGLFVSTLKDYQVSARSLYFFLYKTNNVYIPSNKNPFKCKENKPQNLRILGSANLEEKNVPGTFEYWNTCTSINEKKKPQHFKIDKKP